MTKPALIIGAAGGMTRVTTGALTRALPDHTFILADINQPDADALARELGPSRVQAVRLDLFDNSRLRELVGMAGFVFHGAGPYYRTADPVRHACIDLHVPYMDIDDDVESALRGLAMDTFARAAGVPLFIGHGASPGCTNVLAKDCFGRLEVVESLEVAWCVGDEGQQELGDAVLDHALHLGAGDAVRISGGKRVVTQSYEATTRFPMQGSLGDYVLFETAHPEPLMLNHSWPHVAEIICWGGMHPFPVNGIIRGIARAAASAHLSAESARSFLRDVLAGRRGSLRGWRYAWAGMKDLERLGYCDRGSAAKFLWREIRGVTQPFVGGIAVRARGLHDGVRKEVVRASPPTAHNALWGSMSAVTGLSAAAFVLLALRRTDLKGTCFPESWVNPEDFYAALRDFAPPGTTVVDPIVHERVLLPSDAPLSSTADVNRPFRAFNQ